VKREMKLPIFIDGRNLYDPALMYATGFIYRGLGRGYGQTQTNGHGARNGAAQPAMNWNGWSAAATATPKGT
jgi:hypothetical protein